VQRKINMSEKRTGSDANISEEITICAGRAGAAALNTARKIGTETSELSKQAYEQGARGAHYVSRNAEAQPHAALAIVGAVGFLLGYLVGRTS
jgi:ElaB/YqjD/DUF883 family membrane-anchored ribosome-binding protein